MEMLSRYWWLAIVRGVISILFGIFAFIYPGATLAALVLWFGIWAVFNGVSGIFAFFAYKQKHDHRVWQLIVGLLSIAVGIMTFMSPNVTALVLIIYIAAWAFVQGIFEIITALRIYSVSGAWMLLLSGIASVIFSLLILWNPLPGAIALLWLIAAYAIVFGVLAIGFGLRMRGIAKQFTAPMS